MWGPLVLLGFLMNVVGNGFVVYAQQYVPSGLTAVLIATTPFWSALVERLLPNGERFSQASAPRPQPRLHAASSSWCGRR